MPTNPVKGAYDMSKQEINFTQQTLNQLPAAERGKRVYYYDTRQAGLQIAVTDRGAKSFYVYRKIKGKPTRVFLGAYPDMKIEQARKAAQKTLGKIADNIDPVAEKRAERVKSVALQKVFADYLTARKNLKPYTIYQYERILDVAFEDWLNKPLLSITKDMIAKRHTELGTKRGEHYANGAMRVLRALFNFADGQYEGPQGRSLVPENPVKRLSQTRAWYPNKRRDSVIKPHQLPAWFKAVLDLKATDERGGAGTVADFLLVLLFTGLRLNEAAKLTWEQVDFKAKTLTILDTKNRSDHVLPLSDYLHDLLETRHGRASGAYVFPGEGKAGHLVEPRRQVRKVIEHSGVDFLIHDLRRTFVTVAESLDIPAYALKRLLNHKSTNDVTAGYIVIDAQRLLKPMQDITDYLLSVAEIKPKATVKSISSRRTK